MYLYLQRIPPFADGGALNSYYTFVECIEQWLFDNKFMVVPILRNIASTGTSALQQNWRALHGSLFDSTLGMAAAGAMI